MSSGTGVPSEQVLRETRSGRRGGTCAPRSRCRRGVQLHRAAGYGTGYGNHLSAQHHAEMLRHAGFSEVGVVWQYGDEHVLVAVP